MPRKALNKRQLARIGAAQRKRGSSEPAIAATDAENLIGTTPLEGTVIVRYGKQAVVRSPDGTLVPCQMRQHIGQVVCGDQVIWQASTATQGVILAIAARSSLLERPDYKGQPKAIAANITQLVCVLAPEPLPSGYLIDQYLIAAELLGLQALLILNKCDLADTAETQALKEQLEWYAKIGYPVLYLSSKTGKGLEALPDYFANHTSILVGQSGVGKSSLVNRLIPDQQVQTGAISLATGHGRHTTTATTLYALPTGGKLIDSPGVRSFRLTLDSRAALERGFREFATLLGRCHYANCSHTHEPDCALIDARDSGKIAPWRLAHFQQMAQALEKKAR